MIKSRIINLALVFLTAACYATSFAVDDHGHDHGHEEETSHEDEGHEDHGHVEHEEHAGKKDTHLDHDDHDEHGHEKQSAVKLDQEAMQDFGIIVETARPGTLDIHTTLPGEIQVNQDRQAHIVPRYPGLVIEVKKTIGDGVRKGEVLAILEGNESLAPYELKSLIDGIIIEKHITLGESLAADDVVFTVADLDTVWVDRTVYQRNIASVRRGQEVVISGGEHLPIVKGTISYVSPTVDKHTRTGHARVVLANSDGSWKPGLFVTGKIALDHVKVAVMVPKTALQTIEGSQTIFVKVGDGYVPTPIKVGRKNKSHVEIISGLRPGERYVSRGGFTLKAELARGELEHAGHAH